MDSLNINKKKYISLISHLLSLQLLTKAEEDFPCRTVYLIDTATHLHRFREKETEITVKNLLFNDDYLPCKI
jgi:hypothetical protein